MNYEMKLRNEKYNYNMNEFIERINITSLNGSDLAYIGDAYFELWIRMYLLSKGYTKPNDLHQLCLKYVAATSHAIIVKELLSMFNEKELEIFKRGRNYNYKHKAKGAKLSEYLMSSGFEAIIGYLFLTKEKERLEEILKCAVHIIEENNE